MALLEIKNLSFTYPNCSSPALLNIDFSVEAGELCLVLGKSGSGKSTLLRLLKKELAPFGTASGEILLNAKSVAFVNQNVESNIVTDTVMSELAFALENSGADNNSVALRIAEAASYFNLNNIVNEKTDKLSGGTKQLLALAGAVTISPDTLLLDEPVSQLDSASAEAFINTVVKLNKEQGITVIISEHKSERLLNTADKIIYLDGGTARVFGSAGELSEYLISENDAFKAALPSYTLAIKEHPTEFSQAKKYVSSFEYSRQPEAELTQRALEAKGLCFAYDKHLQDVLFRLDFTAYRGKINVIVGANGSGKTTLLKVLSGVLKAYSGKVRANGRLCYMPQNVKAMFLADSVFDELCGEEAVIKQFQLDSLRERNPFDLSGGEEQRLALAKAFQTGADILLLDEPTKSVDACFKLCLADMLRELCRHGKTIIIVTHDIEFAGRYADYASFLFDRAIVASAPRKEFFAGLGIYSTALSRLTGGRAVSLDDISNYNE